MHCIAAANIERKNLYRNLHSFRLANSAIVVDVDVLLCSTGKKRSVRRTMWLFTELDNIRTKLILLLLFVSGIAEARNIE